VGLVLLLVAVEAIEVYTVTHRSEEFWRRVGPIREGMTEAEVRAVAGAPDEFVTGIASTTDRYVAGASCGEASGTAASSGSTTEVACLDDRRIVMKTYLETRSSTCRRALGKSGSAGAS
jgi:hypothetical protein